LIAGRNIYFKIEKKLFGSIIIIIISTRGRPTRRRRVIQLRMVTNAMTIVIANIRVKITTENAIKSDAIENGTEIEERNEEGT
jgi:hypothetical protein